MAANLRLVANTTWPVEEKTVLAPVAAKKLDQFLLASAIDSNPVNDSKPAYRMLTMVIAVHAAVLAGMLISNTEVSLPEKPVTPMTVSLVNAPSMTEPKIEPVAEPEQPKPVVIKKQKPVHKEPQQQRVQPVIETASNQPVVSEPVEQPVMAEAAASDNTVKAESSARVAEAPAKVEAVAEPVVEPPKFGAAYLNNPAPTYPPVSRRFGEQGRVLLRVLVSENGLAQSVQLDSSSGYEKLDRAAMEAVKKWSFIPARRSNQPVSAYVLVPIKFSLSS